MNRLPLNSIFHSSRRASALIITLAILTLVAILVVGLSETMRVERASANTHLERERAADFAQLGVDRIVALLKTNIGDVQKSWISTPGLIVCSSGTDFKLTKEVNLYSGVSVYSSSTSGYPASCLPPNLNMPMVGDTTGTSCHLITNRPADPENNSGGKVVDLPLKWIYVRSGSDGSCVWDTEEPPDLTNKSKPIVGRFAYWADDESSKINYNTAWKRPLPTNNPPPQCAVSLFALNNVTGSGTTVMTTAMVNALHNAVTTSNPAYLSVKRFFNSPQDAHSTGTDIGNMIEANKFALTHYNHDPNTTFFNEPRIVLTTHAQYAMSGTNSYYPFLDILKKGETPITDPGDYSNIDQTKLATTVNMLIGYLQRTDWPMTSGTASLQGKYYSSNANRLAQLALNIIDYVRCKESTRVSVEPLRGDNKTGTFLAQGQNLADPGSYQTEYGFMGMTRAPLINEVGIWLSSDCKTALVIVELYLPKRFGIDSTDVVKDPDTGETHSLSTEINGTSFEAEIAAAECDGGTTIAADGYKVIKRVIDVSSVSSLNPRPSQVSVRVAYARKYQDKRFDIAPEVSYGLVTSGNKADYALRLNVDLVGIAQADAMTKIQSREVDDPRVNKFQWDWHASGVNSFGKQNACYSPGVKAADSSISPQQDTDGGGKISAASLYMPYPKGKKGTQGDNSAGMVTSPAELGVIHTGVQGSGMAGTPWRTLRLQPSKDDASVVPDWAFMDLFAAPTMALSAQIQKNIQPIFNPHGTSVGGRVSVNAQVQPFGNSNYPACPTPLERADPLVAAFYNGANTVGGVSGTMSLNDAKTIARNIYDHQLAVSGKNFSQANLPGSKAKFYTSPGEVVEIQGVADDGEESEMRLCFASNLITTRGNVFSIYTIGQSLKQTPNGALVVRGEQRLQAMVERYLDSSTNAIKFRTVYFRNLTP